MHCFLLSFRLKIGEGLRPLVRLCLGTGSRRTPALPSTCVLLASAFLPGRKRQSHWEFHQNQPREGVNTTGLWPALHPSFCPYLPFFSFLIHWSSISETLQLVSHLPKRKVQALPSLRTLITRLFMRNTNPIRASLHPWGDSVEMWFRECADRSCPRSVKEEMGTESQDLGWTSLLQQHNWGPTGVKLLIFVVWLLASHSPSLSGTVLSHKLR